MRENEEQVINVRVPSIWLSESQEATGELTSLDTDHSLNSSEPVQQTPAELSASPRVAPALAVPPVPVPGLLSAPWPPPPQ